MAADSFKAAIAFLLPQEGGFSDDPRDPGGATFQGITLVEYRRYYGDLTLTAEDLKNMTPGERDDIYHANYWVPVRGDDLPPGVDLSVFDMGVNAGVGASAKLLQRCLGIDQDGKIGPFTLKAVRATDAAVLIRRLEGAQAAYYRGLKNFPTFGGGWLNRCMMRMSAAFALISGPGRAKAAK